MEKNQEHYSTAYEWLRHNRNELGKYSGEWIAFTNTGVIFHDKSGQVVSNNAGKTKETYALKYVHPSEVSNILRIPTIHI